MGKITQEAGDRRIASHEATMGRRVPENIPKPPGATDSAPIASSRLETVGKDIDPACDWIDGIVRHHTSQVNLREQMASTCAASSMGSVTPTFGDVDMVSCCGGGRSRSCSRFRAAFGGSSASQIIDPSAGAGVSQQAIIWMGYRDKVMQPILRTHSRYHKLVEK